MPRVARKRSRTGIYHVMLRGVNRQQIFFDEEDNSCFIGLLGHYKKKFGFKLYGYCLMGNHVHLLIQEGPQPIASIFKGLGTAFVFWYNAKYERTGHLFQDRFKSEPVNNQGYFLTALRYILQNPVAAGFCSSPEKYPYSSAQEYLVQKHGITDTDFAMTMVCSPDDPAALQQFICARHDDKCLDIDEKPRKRCTDEKAVKLILEEFGSISPSPGKPQERDAFNRSLKMVIGAGVSIRQLSRLTGLSKKVIESGLK